MEYMKYIQDVQKKPNADFAWPEYLEVRKSLNPMI